jgi:hypothetical protein
VELFAEVFLRDGRFSRFTDICISLAAVKMIIKCLTVLVLRTTWSLFKWNWVYDTTKKWEGIRELCWLPEVNGSIIINSNCLVDLLKKRE